jgi:modification methylase
MIGFIYNKISSYQSNSRIINGDSLTVMREMLDKCLDLVVTSPPYNLKNSTGNGMKDGRGGK